MPKLHIIADMTTEDEKMFFAKALEHHLKRRGRGAITSLAADTGISQPQISRIMAGTSMGSVDSRIKIAEALGTSVEQILILGRSLKSGERRTGAGRRSEDRARGGYPNLGRMLSAYPNAQRYIQMAELAAAEQDIKLALSLLRSALTKIDEAAEHDESEHRGDDRHGAGGA